MQMLFFFFFCFSSYGIALLKESEVFQLCQKNGSASLGPGTTFFNSCISLPLFNAKEEKTELLWVSSPITVTDNPCDFEQVVLPLWASDSSFDKWWGSLRPRLVLEFWLYTSIASLGFLIWTPMFDHPYNFGIITPKCIFICNLTPLYLLFYSPELYFIFVLYYLMFIGNPWNNCHLASVSVDM